MGTKTGYACPVCDVPQADATHLANHLAITASLGRDDHLEWLEEYAPDWADCGPEELGEIVAEYALDLEPETTDVSSDVGHDHAHDHDSEPSRPAVDVETAIARQARQPGRGSMSAETETVLSEARAMTQQLLDDETDDSEASNGDADEDAGED